MASSAVAQTATPPGWFPLPPLPSAPPSDAPSPDVAAPPAPRPAPPVAAAWTPNPPVGAPPAFRPYAAGPPSPPPPAALPPPWPSASAPPASNPAILAPPPATVVAPIEFKPVTLTRLVIKMDLGQPYAVVQFGLFCATNKTVPWTGGRAEQALAPYQDIFHADMQAAGLKTPEQSDELFDTSAATSDYMLAGLITDVHIRTCAPNLADATRVKGEVSMTVQWELYSRLEHRMLATTRTTGVFQQSEPKIGGLATMTVQAFGANVQELAQSAAFRQALAAPARVAGDLIPAVAQARIPLAGSLAAPIHPATEAIGSVVMIVVGNTSGSGVLVSKDGYILTDAHVVSGAREVKVRWSDGLETVGMVVRSINGRDVALVKSEARGRDPVPVRATAAEVGETVFAIGSPMGERFQGTVTRGIVSGKRVFDGFAYIQSDVSVTHGSSGGPLLDDKGRLLGLTVMNVAMGGIPTGINLFIPVKDAMDFLALDQR